MMKTAESYRLAARLYFHCRLLGLVIYTLQLTTFLDLYRATPTHKTVAEIHRLLLSVLSELPSEGPNFTAIYPLWAMFVAAVSASCKGERGMIADLLNGITTRNKGVSLPIWFVSITISEVFNILLERRTSARGYRKHLALARLCKALKLRSQKRLVGRNGRTIFQYAQRENAEPWITNPRWFLGTIFEFNNSPRNQVSMYIYIIFSSRPIPFPSPS